MFGLERMVPEIVYTPPFSVGEFPHVAKGSGRHRITFYHAQQSERRQPFNQWDLGSLQTTSATVLLHRISVWKIVLCLLSKSSQERLSTEDIVTAHEEFCSWQ